MLSPFSGRVGRDFLPKSKPLELINQPLMSAVYSPFDKKVSKIEKNKEDILKTLFRLSRKKFLSTSSHITLTCKKKGDMLWQDTTRPPSISS